MIVLGTAGAGLGSILFGCQPLFAQQKKEKTAGTADSAAYAEVAKTAAECIRTGEACATHCRRELAKGNASMANCSQRVHDMLMLTRSMLELASSGSAYAAQVAPICAKACRACAEACSEHKEHFAHGMHLECKSCLEACDLCEKACQKIA